MRQSLCRLTICSSEDSFKDASSASAATARARSSSASLRWRSASSASRARSARLASSSLRADTRSLAAPMYACCSLISSVLRPEKNSVYRLRTFSSSLPRSVHVACTCRAASRCTMSTSSNSRSNALTSNTGPSGALPPFPFPTATPLKLAATAPGGRSSSSVASRMTAIPRLTGCGDAAAAASHLARRSSNVSPRLAGAPPRGEAPFLFGPGRAGGRGRPIVLRSGGSLSCASASSTRAISRRMPSTSASAAASAAGSAGSRGGRGPAEGATARGGEETGPPAASARDSTRPL
mmetsp:Transcript_9725/g.33892  ORF Transcript_9725/g.33892 Transcript_9725/m.33892 type:complete len:294 (-) Transcript_9725:86-967(-)